MTVTETSGRPPGIVAQGVRRTFGSVEAVRSVDFHAQPGEITALVGPNGAGKTTLLLVLATLLVPDAGSVSVAGYDPMTEAGEVRRRLGWAPDVFGLYDNLTAREYLEFFADAYRIPRPRGQQRAAELLALAHLPEYADSPVHVLSRGQKQRLGVVRAMVHDPEVLILDEPASGLDPRSRVDLKEMLREYAESGRTVVVSSHILSDLEELADRVVFIDKGLSVGEHVMSALPTSATSRRTWRLRSLDEPALVAALTRNGYSHSEPTAAGIDVDLADDAAAAALIAGLVNDKVPLVSCAPIGGALEAAYLELTEGRS
ncbi:MAG: type transport system ATP-binding protein [Frankiales bacterium]|nr:type transport system ATP-binding protein [Frankiales bacterium]